MKKKFSPLKNRLLDFIHYKGINNSAFYQNTGISNGTLDKKTGLSEGNIEKFLAAYPDVRLNWFFKGELPIENNVNAGVKTNEKKADSNEIELLKKEIEALKLEFRKAVSILLNSIEGLEAKDLENELRKSGINVSYDFLAGEQ